VALLIWKVAETVFLEEPTRAALDLLFLLGRLPTCLCTKFMAHILFLSMHIFGVGWFVLDEFVRLDQTLSFLLFTVLIIVQFSMFTSLPCGWWFFCWFYLESWGQIDVEGAKDDMADKWCIVKDCVVYLVLVFCWLAFFKPDIESQVNHKEESCKDFFVKALPYLENWFLLVRNICKGFEALGFYAELAKK
jgi:hypothetical protein